MASRPARRCLGNGVGKLLGGGGGRAGLRHVDDVQGGPEHILCVSMVEVGQQVGDLASSFQLLKGSEDHGGSGEWFNALHDSAMLLLSKGES